jgi:hypothetical protein
MNTLTTLLSLAVLATDQTPAPEDVKAGWLGFAVWIGLALAVVLLAFSLVKHLKRVNFEEEPDQPSDGPESPRDGSATQS